MEMQNIQIKTQKIESSGKEGPAEVLARHQYLFPYARAVQ